MKADTTSEAFFEEKYRANADPWHFASSRYEQERYAAIFSALDFRRYDRAFEPGCSIGILTARLAAICDQVVAMDISSTAVSLATNYCKVLPNVDIVQGALPARLAGSFDLIVFSEIGYYFNEDQLLEVIATLIRKLRKPGILLAAHWLGSSSDHRISGDLVHETIGQVPGLSHQYAERHIGFRLDRWSHA